MIARRPLLTLLILGVFAVAAMGQDDACAGSETINEPTEQGSQETQGEEPAEEPKETAGVGDTLTLEGFEGLRMDVTLESVEDAAGSEFDQPMEEGAEFVAVNLGMENVSEQTYNDSPGNGAVLVDADDQQYQSTIMIGGDCTGSESVRIAPDDTRSVCIPFEVPPDANLRLFQFALESGFSEQGGEWKLDGGSSGG